MQALKTTVRSGAAVLAAFVIAPAFAQQQQKPLSMTYQLLGIKVEAAQSAPPPANRCTAGNWVASIGACGRDLLAKIAPRSERAPQQPEQADAGSAVAPPPEASGATLARAPESTVPRAEALPAAELPTLGSDPRYLRTSAREPLPGSSRTADLTLRVGSKYRYRGTEENGWDWYRFSDTTYQTHVQNNGHKALGVELLVPFQ